MLIRDIPTQELRRLVAETERAVGPSAASAVVLRRELLRREWPDLVIYRDGPRRSSRPTHPADIDDARSSREEVRDVPL